MILILASLLLVMISAMGISLLVTGSLPEIPGINMLDHSFHEKKEVIVIDPGHGGYDAGGDAQEVYEKDITLQVALYLGKELEQRGYTVVYTREKDIALGEYEFDDLSQRVSISEANHADAMLSLHTNIAEAGYERIYGFEVYQNETNSVSKELAEHTLRALDNLHYSMNRGVKDGAIYQVISLNQTPAVLIEMGFLNDEQDRAYLTSESGKKDIAKAIADAVDQTFQ